MQVQTDKRSSLRLSTNFPIKLKSDNSNANVLNISETGICFDCEKSSLPEDFLLSITLPSSKSKQAESFSAKVVWSKASDNTVQYGASFSSLDENKRSLIKDFMFSNYAEKASSTITDNDHSKTEVQNFFKNDVRRYYEAIATQAQKIDNESKVEDVEKGLINLTNELLLKGEALEATVNNDKYMKNVKNVFREVTGHWLYKSPIMKMANDKPRGYPGDYKLFDIIYDNKPLSEDNGIGYYCDKYFLSNDYAKAARARKNKMKNILQDLVENSEKTTLRLLNVACGPSREIRELLFDPIWSSRKNIVFTGLDYDEEALNYSKSVLSNLPSNVETRFLHQNVLNLGRDKKYYDLIGKQDIIYILGLTEYLPDRVFKGLINFLFNSLNSKGMLVITYKDKDITFPSLPPEWFADWAFIKRTKEDLIEATKDLGPEKFSLKIEREGTGTIFFLILTKD